MTQRYDVVIVGAGIVGLANAWAAAKLGHRVVVLEASPYAQAASIRNFGMVWPIGQPAGEMLQTALHSRELWLQIAAEAGFWHHTHGSVYLAIQEDELAVMDEFAQTSSDLGYDCDMLEPHALAQHCPAMNRDHVIGGFYSRTEVGVDPREAIAKIPKTLTERYGVKFHFNTTAVQCDAGSAVASDGRVFEASERIVVCSGAEIRTLFPNVFAVNDVTRCKLQMFATGPQPDNWQAGAMVASGSSLRHYHAFRDCPSLPAMKHRIATENPELDQYGIHFMAAQNGLGEVVMGDSHEYGEQIGPFDQNKVETLMLRGLQDLLDLPDFKVARRWQGIYLKTLNATHLCVEPAAGVTVFNGLGGAGMTLSFGLAEQFWTTQNSNAPRPIGNF